MTEELDNEPERGALRGMTEFNKVQVYTVGYEWFDEEGFHSSFFWSFDPESVHDHIMEEGLSDWDYADEEERATTQRYEYWVEAFYVEFGRREDMNEEIEAAVLE